MKCRSGSIPQHKAFAFKILPTDFTEDYLLRGQTSIDWSAIYAQFTIQHAVSYLPNHFDRGYESADLVLISTNEESLQYIVCDDERIAISSLSSSEKSQLLTEHIKRDVESTFGTSGPLLQRIGEDLHSMVVLFDADREYECAIPHCLMTNQRFSFQRLARFHKDPIISWKVKDAHIYNKLGVGGSDEGYDEMIPILLCKDEKEDASLLGSRIQSSLQPIVDSLNVLPPEDICTSIH